eukprot:CAMPEP_0183335160 /NCGR_PEP_ID=MMETSP0164_2-20130417/3538_1 /TAXON_ID=221442 /ORGANISM="Coccolithus pelagicus ssp braarudi, Strain PLY182g" /LENGTH=49 /DNA_ID=CAMNT_0025504451 /DNA_START=85 /DNA_END=234 /DNA_ORIENTATION=-
MQARTDDLTIQMCDAHSDHMAPNDGNFNPAHSRQMTPTHGACDLGEMHI